MPQVTVEEPFSSGVPARTPERATLDKRRYIEASAVAAEWEAIWTRCWLFAGLESDLPDVGDYFVYNVGVESIVILRDEESRIRAFYNVCQHRGNRIFTNERGAVQQVACPYHGWRYALDGQLVIVPDEERFCPAVDKEERSL